MAEKQRTLNEAVILNGVGLHTGEKVTIEICPAPANHGYKFQRIDLEGQPIINADCDLVVATDRGTTLEFNGARVYTTEHVLAALYGMQVDNALIKINGPEIPIMDGSSLLFVNAFEKVGYSAFFEYKIGENAYLQGEIRVNDMNRGGFGMDPFGTSMGMGGFNQSSYFGSPYGR